MTRKERRFLLALSLLGLALVKAGLVPTRISALGIDFKATDQRSLVTIVGCVTFYFLIAFTTYAAADMVRGRTLSKAARLKRRVNIAGRLTGGEAPINVRWFGEVTWARKLIDFAFPVLLAVYALIEIWRWAPGVASAGN